MEKSIRMPAALLADWLATLRSGEITQAKGTMLSDEGMCCLGVLQYCAGGHKVEAVEDGKVPSFEWLEKHRIEFKQVALPGLSETCCVPYVDVGGNAVMVSVLNDGGVAYDTGRKKYDSLPFPEIADLIERQAEGV